MRTLKLNRDPVTVALPYGITATLKRATAIDLELARGAMREALAALRDGDEALARYGLDGVDATGRSANLADPAEAVGLAVLIGAVETAHRALIEWRQDGVALPTDRAALALALQDSALHEALLGAIDRASRILVIEGNDSTSSGAGSQTSAVGDPAPGPAIAPAAAPPANPAPQADAAPTADSARRPNIDPGPSPAPSSGRSPDAASSGAATDSDPPASIAPSCADGSAAPSIQTIWTN